MYATDPQRDSIVRLEEAPLLARAARFPFLTGFESTFMPDKGVDVLETTAHDSLLADDLRLVQAAGVRTLRYPVPWHRIETRRGQFDWGWMDQAMGLLLELGLDPIVDPVHHTSFPAWLERGFADPSFPDIYTDFVVRFAQRYPWVKKYTPFNEPFATTFFCSHQGIWRPFGTGPHSFIPMAVNVGRAICLVSVALKQEVPGAQIFHVDTCESHSALDPESEDFAVHLNERRFMLHDLVLGRINTRHPLYEYMAGHGLTPADVEWFQAHPAHIDVLGLDYYAHHEHQFHVQGYVVPSAAPLGFARVAREYVARYGLPVMLSETNIRGFASDRLSWLKYMVEQAEMLVRDGIDWRGFCWFPFVDSTDWDSLLCRADGHLDPVGIYWLDDARQRHASELSDVFGRLARGECGSEGLPAYRFQEPVLSQVAGFLPQMAHWDWREP